MNSSALSTKQNPNDNIQNPETPVLEVGNARDRNSTKTLFAQPAPHPIINEPLQIVHSRPLFHEEDPLSHLWDSEVANRNFRPLS